MPRTRSIPSVFIKSCLRPTSTSPLPPFFYHLRPACSHRRPPASTTASLTASLTAVHFSHPPPCRPQPPSTTSRPRTSGVSSSHCPTCGARLCWSSIPHPSAASRPSLRVLKNSTKVSKVLLPNVVHLIGRRQEDHQIEPSCIPHPTGPSATR